MSREIKFRAWDKFNGAMIYPLPIGSITSGQIIDRFGDECPVMQYTGLKDKNGMGVYEGDILKCSDNRIVKVIFGETGWMIESKPFSKMEIRLSEENSVIRMNADRYGKLKNTEVIGSIYENPELLK